MTTANGSALGQPESPVRARAPTSEPTGERHIAPTLLIAPSWAREWTEYSGDHELWLRSEALVAGRFATMEARWTDHRLGEPLPAARITVLMTCAPRGPIRVDNDGTNHDFRWRWRPEHAGPCELLVRAFTATKSSEARIVISVAPASSPSPGQAAATPTIGFGMVKQAQWRAGVRTVRVSRRWLRAASPTTVAVLPSARGDAQLTAPAAGRVGRAESGVWPRQHTQIARDVELLTLALTRPRPLRGLPSHWLPTDQGRHDIDTPIGHLRLRSPVSGGVGRVAVHPGQVVAAGDALLTVFDETTLVLRVAWSPRERAAHSLRPQLLLLPDRETAIAVPMAEMHADTTTPGHLLIPLHNPTRRWRVGERVAAAIEAGPSREAVAVPAAAVLSAGDERYVFVQLGGQRFERRELKLGIWSGDAWAVLDGVRDGDRVVVGGIDAVRQAQSDARARRK